MPDFDSQTTRREFLRGMARAAAAAPLSQIARWGMPASAAILSGCDPKRSEESLARRLIVGMTKDIKTLDPAYQSMALDGSIISNIHDNLTWYGRDLRIAPRLATDWQSPDNGRTWTFRLRQGVKFHDGTDFTAHAVKFHFDRISDPKTASTRMTRVARLDATEVVDDFTIRFHMKVPFSVWPEVLRDPFAGIVSPAAVKALDDQRNYTLHPIGSGPFEFVEYVPDSHILLRRNPNYWGGDIIRFEELEFKPVRENTTRLILLEQGKLDLADLFYGHVEAVRDSARLEIDPVPMLAIRYIAMNTQKPPFDDVRVRRAANYAVDRDAIVKYAFRGNADPASGPLPPALPSFNHEMETYSYDPDKARALLREAGHPDGIHVELWGTDEAGDKAVAETVMEQLRTVGIHIRAQHFDRAVFWDRVDAFITPEGNWYPRREGVFDMAIAGWVGGESAFGYLDPLFRSQSYSNNSFYSSPEVDALLNKVMATTDTEAQNEIYRQMQAQIVSDAPWIFTYHSHILKAYHPRVSGWKTHPADEYEFANVFLGTGRA